MTAEDRETIADLEAFRDALTKSLGDSGMERKHLAAAMDVTDTTVGNWLGKGSPPGSPAETFRLEAVLDVPAGSLSKYLGYLPLTVRPIRSVEAALEADRRLSRLGRRIVLAAYNQALAGDSEDDTQPRA